MSTVKVKFIKGDDACFKKGDEKVVSANVARTLLREGWIEDYATKKK